MNPLRHVLLVGALMLTTQAFRTNAAAAIPMLTATDATPAAQSPRAGRSAIAARFTSPTLA